MYGGAAEESTNTLRPTHLPLGLSTTTLAVEPPPWEWCVCEWVGGEAP
jgi:hypothetical protein